MCVNIKLNPNPVVYALSSLTKLQLKPNGKCRPSGRCSSRQNDRHRRNGERTIYQERHRLRRTEPDVLHHKNLY